MATLTERINKRFWIPLSAVLLAIATLVPFAGFLVFVALIPWVKLLPGLRKPFRSGYLFGLIYGGAQLFWIFQLVSKWTESLPLGILTWLIATSLMAIYYGLATWLAAFYARADKWWGVPLVWAGVEVFRSYIPVFAFPWALVASPLADYPFLTGWARLGTIFLVGFWVVVINVCLARRARNSINFAVLGFLAGTAFLLLHVGSTENRRVTIGQPAVDMAFGDPAMQELLLAGHIDKITTEAETDQSSLLVLPEGVARGYRPKFRLSDRFPTIFGSQTGDGPYYQSAISYDNGNWDQANKSRLVIFGEFVPFRDQLPFLKEFRLPGGDLAAGDKVSAVSVGSTMIGPLLCFEALFPDIAFRQSQNGAQVLTILSNDDWFMGTTAPRQLANAATWRAVENGTTVLRAASLGKSFIVNASGSVVGEAPMKQPYALTRGIVVPAKPQALPILPLFPFLAVLSLPLTPIILRLKPRK